MTTDLKMSRAPGETEPEPSSRRSRGSERDQRPRRSRRRPFRGPAVDIEETADALFLRAELPGFEREDFTVEVAPHSVTIRGVKEEERSERSQGFSRKDRAEGPFLTHINLPAEIDVEAATAGYRDGILRLMLPKTPASRARLIHIEVDE